MGGFILVSRKPGDQKGQALSSTLQTLAQDAGISVSDLTPLAWLAVEGPHLPKRIQVGHWTLVGDVFNRRNPRLPATGQQDPHDYERKLMARFWGRYVGLRFKPGGELDGLLRDPSGALDCLAWEHSGLTLAASTTPEWLTARTASDWRIDFENLAQVMRRPLLASADLMLEGPKAVLPGTVQALPLTTDAVPIWRPVDHARRSLEPGLTVERASATLRDALDETVSGLATAGGALASEVSGGLDSSLIAGSLVHSGHPVVAWLNAYGRTKESDERAYVGALREKLGITPQSTPHASGPLSGELLERISQGPRPPLNALDVHHDLDWITRTADASAEALMTGKGGDGILVQSVTPDVFTDLWKAIGNRAVLRRDTYKLAAINEVSIWTLLQGARTCRPDGPRPTLFENLLLPREGPRKVHPWLKDCEAFGPAKTFQIAGVADSVSRHGPSLLTPHIDVRHPMCAQPVIEACLSIPTPLMTYGVRDRGLARHTFRDRLPDLIANRRSKGDMSRIYGHMILDNRAFLGEFLLEGRLVRNAILDRAAVEKALSREQLTWRGRASAIMVAVAFEAWVRAWERRLSPASRG